jgi:hypothetical protein
MAMSTRRDFILSAAAVSAGCVELGTKAPTSTGGGVKPRQPAGGQSWQYVKHDVFTGAIVDTQTDRVSSVGQAIEIETRSEKTVGTPIKYPSWGAPWWHKYLGRDPSAGPLPNEIQEPWGLVLVDSHWTELQVYKTPIPLWPSELRPGWSTTVDTYYMIPGSEETMPWQLTMRALRWESVTVPAGHFTALHYYNLIDFRFTNVSERTAALRQENIWFAPEIGRWVKRESYGSFREDVGTEITEGSYRWELLSWT